MTTQRQVKKLLTSFARRHHDVAIRGNWLVLKPVHHLVRTVVISPTSSADWFQPQWLIMHLCTPPKQMPLHRVQRLFHAGPARWRWSDAAMPEALFDEIETKTLPFLREIETFDDLLAQVPSRSESGPPWDRIMIQELAVHSARGDLQSARKICDLIRTHPVDWSAPHWDNVYFAVIQPLCSLVMADDIPGLASLLHGWEGQSVRTLHLESLWEATPFPLELAC